MKELIEKELAIVGYKHIGARIKKLGFLPQIIEQTKFLPEEIHISQRLWHIINDKKLILCSCNKIPKYNSLEKGYNIGCSFKCPDVNIARGNSVKKTKSKYSKNKRKEILDKRISTNLDRHKHVAGHTEAGRQKQKDVYKDKEKVANINTRIKNTLKGKYGQDVDCGFKTPNAIDAIETALTASGVNNFFQTQKCKDNRRKLDESIVIAKSNKIRFRNYYFKFVKELQKEGFEILCDVNDFCGVYFQNYNFKHVKCGNIFESNTYGGKRNMPICRKCNPINRFQSKQEKEVLEYVSNFCTNLISNDRNIIKPLELDIVIPDQKIAIEFSGLRWHSTKFKDKDYHFNKMKNCKENGYRLITIFDDEWNNKQDIVKNILKNILSKSNGSIGARKCIIVKIDKKIAKEFTELNHLQGHSPAAVYYGAYYKDELVSVMSCGRNRRITGAKESCWEIIRFCSNINVSGLASKMFSKFVKEHMPTKVISYCDLRWFTGSVYEKLGMKLTNKPAPGYWYTKDYESRIHRYNFTKHRLVKDFNADPNLTESAIMNQMGYDTIWDCGQARFEIEF